MKKLITIVIALTIVSAIVAFNVYDHYKNKANKVQEMAQLAKKAEEEEKETKSIRTGITKMVERYNAVDNWAEKIKDRKRIFSIELEKSWVMNRPILFIGSIKDIATVDKENYQVRITSPRRTIFDIPQRKGTKDIMGSYRVRAILELDLLCKKVIVDTFLKDNPKALSQRDLNVAIIANIKHVRSTEYVMSDETIISGNIGRGDCLDILFIGRDSPTVLDF